MDAYSPFHEIACLVCPACEFLEFPGCGAHSQILSARKGNSHFACAGCVADDKQNKEEGVQVSFLTHLAATDMSSPWAEACRNCWQTRADCRAWLITDEEAEATAVAMDEEREDAVPVMALLCGECHTVQFPRAAGGRLTRRGPSGGIADPHDPAVLHDPSRWPLRHYAEGCDGRAELVPVLLSKSECSYVARDIGTTPRLPADSRQAPGYLPPVRWITAAEHNEEEEEEEDGRRHSLSLAHLARRHNEARRDEAARRREAKARARAEGRDRGGRRGGRTRPRGAPLEEEEDRGGVDPLHEEPHPVWRDRAYVGVFGDAFVRDTELEGGHIAPSLDVVAEVLARLASRRRAWLSEFSDEDAARLARVAAVLEQGAKQAHAVREILETGDEDLRNDMLVAFVRDWVERLGRMRAGEVLACTGGWMAPAGGHAIMHAVIRGEHGFSFTVSNTGGGLQHHPATVAADGKEKFRTTLRFDNVTVADDAFWLLFFRAQVYASDDHDDRYLYRVLYPHLAGTTLGQAAPDEAVDPLAEWRTPQRAGNCYLKSVLELARYLMRMQGLTRGQCKQAAFAVRRELLAMVAADLAAVDRLHDDSDLPLVRLATGQCAYVARKEAEAGRMGEEEMEALLAEVERVERAAGEKGFEIEPSGGAQPEAGDDEPFEESFPGFGAFASADRDFDEAAGPAREAAPEAAVQFAPPPPRASTFAGAIAALESTLDLCGRVTAAGAAASSGGMVARLRVCGLITTLVCDVLPAEWPDAGVPAAQQRRASSLLHRACRAYTAASLSVAADDGLLVMAGLLAALDAVVRVRACDTPSAVSEEMADAFVSTRNGCGATLAECTAVLRPADPRLVALRGRALAHFASREARGKAELFPYRQAGSGRHATVALRADGDTLEFVRAACRRAGHVIARQEWGASAEQTEAEAVARWLYSDDAADPGLADLRDSCLLFHLALLPRADRLEMFPPRPYRERDAAVRWTFAAPMGRRDVVLASAKVLGRARCVWIAGETPRSAADAGHTCESDVLHAHSLPDYGGYVQPEAAEELLSYLAAPYVRIPLVLGFFAAKDRVGLLACRELRDVLEAVLFEPGQWCEPGVVVTHAPAEREKLGCEDGALANELRHAPEAVVEPLLRVLDGAAAEGGEALLFAVLAASRVEAFTLHQRSRRDAALARALRGGALARKLEQCWRDAERGDTEEAVRVAAHLALLFGGAAKEEFDEEAVLRLLGALAFVMTWHAHGLGVVEEEEEEEEEDEKKEDRAAAALRRMLASVTGRGDGKRKRWRERTVPEADLFLVVDRQRGALLGWFASAAPDAVDRVLDGVVSAVHRGTGRGSTRWSPRPDLAGAYLSSDGTTEVRVQTAEVFLRDARVRPVPDRVALHPDFARALGPRQQHCSVVASRQNCEVLQIFGSPHTVEVWEAPGRFERLAGLPVPLPSGGGEAEPWRCVARRCGEVCGGGDGRCQACGEPKPTLPATERFGCAHPDGTEHSRRYGSAALPESERWVAALLEPVLSEMFGGAGKPHLRFSLWLPREPSDAGALSVRLLGRADSTWKEVVASRAPATVQVFNLVEHGRRAYRSLVYASDGRLCLADLGARTCDRARQWSACNRHSAGDIHAEHPPGLSLVVSRGGSHRLVPRALLRGLLPDALLDRACWFDSGRMALEGDGWSASVSPSGRCAVRRRSDGLCLLRLAPHPLGTLLARVENLSHVLAWGRGGRLERVELPRLGLVLDGRLRSQDLSGWSVSGRGRGGPPGGGGGGGLPFSLLLENERRELALLVPNHPLHRPRVASCPFSNELVPDRGCEEWARTMRSRAYLYRVHASHGFLMTDTLESALYLLLLRLLRRQYDECALLLPACAVDTALSPEDEFVFAQFERTLGDKHPDAHAVRLRLLLGLAFGPHFDRVAWRERDGRPWSVERELEEYLKKAAHAGRLAKLSRGEELALLERVQPRESLPLRNRLARLRGESVQAVRPRVGLVHQWARWEARGVAEFFAARQPPVPWTGTVCYDRPGTEGGRLLDAVRDAAGDNALGSAHRLGFAFLYELATGACPARLAPGAPDCSRALGALLSRLAFARETGWAERRPASALPWALLAAAARDEAPHPLPQGLGGGFPTHKAGNPVSDFLAAARRRCAEVVASEEWEEAALLYEALTGDAEEGERGDVRVAEGPAAAAEAVGASDTACGERALVPGECGLGEEELRELLNRPLARLADRFAREQASDAPAAAGELPFDLDGHPDASSHSARALLERMREDARAYAAQPSRTLSLLSTAGLADALERQHESDSARAADLMRRALALVNDAGAGPASFRLARHCGVEGRVDARLLAGCLASSRAGADLARVNPHARGGAFSAAIQLAASSLLLTSRAGLASRALALVPRAAAGDGLTAAALAALLLTARHYTGAAAGTYDPRFLLFEYLFNVVLRRAQVELVRSFAAAGSAVHQMIMGAGKTTVVVPLLCMLLADGQSLVTVAVPAALLGQSLRVLRSRFSAVVVKRICTFDYSRDRPDDPDAVRALVGKLDAARRSRGVVLCTDTAVKSFALKFVELLHCVERNEDRLKSETADAMSGVLALWRGGALVMDEVDLLLHPLRSELNFPIGARESLEPSPERWELPMRLLDALREDEGVRAAVEEGLRARAVEGSVLLSTQFYERKMMPPFARWLVGWLRGHGVCRAAGGADRVLAYLLRRDGAVVVEPSHMRLLNLGHDWLRSFLPHCLSKIDRVSYGLAPRGLTAVPFVAKDVPSESSEFAQPDVLIGLTVLAYRAEGLRESDTRALLASLQARLAEELGPEESRPSARLYRRWGGGGSLARLQLADDAQAAAAHRLLRRHPAAVDHYLRRHVFPAVAHHQAQCLSASGQELGGEALFGRRLGFSGTPSDLLPLGLGPCRYERGTDGRVVSVLVRSSRVVPLGAGWTPRAVLRRVAAGGYRALIDSGALVTGMGNEEVARALLPDLGPDVEGVVFLDARDDTKRVLLRGGGRPVLLSQCGLEPGRRFTFYDQVHATGIDIAQAPSAVAAVTLGKDMTFRDLAQGAYRMRGLGAGQRVDLLVTPGVAEMVGGTGGRADDVLKWLVANSMRAERVMFTQLCVQNLHGVIRLPAWLALVQDCQQRRAGAAAPARFRQKGWLSDCVDLFRADAGHEVLGEVPEPRPLGAALDDLLAVHAYWIRTDEQRRAAARVRALVAADGSDGGAAPDFDREMVSERQRETEQQRESEREVATEWERGDEAERAWRVDLGWRGAAAYEAAALAAAPMPGLCACVMVSSNFYRPAWGAGPRRVRGVRVVMEVAEEEEEEEEEGEQQPMPSLRLAAELGLDEQRARDAWHAAAETRCRGRRYVAVTLAEACAVRRAIHTGQAASCRMALRALDGGRLLAATASYAPDPRPFRRDAAFQVLRFLDARLYYTPAQAADLVRGLARVDPARRATALGRLLRCRRRARRVWSDAPVAEAVAARDEGELLAWRLVAARASARLALAGVAPLRAFEMFDSRGCGELAAGDSRAALEWLGLPGGGRGLFAGARFAGFRDRVQACSGGGAVESDLAWAAAPRAPHPARFWACPACTLVNPAHAEACAVCFTARR